MWPLSEYVARHSLDSPKRALAALHAMTQRFSAEWAVRPFIEHHPELTFKTLARWTRDPSEYVRRSVANHLNDIAKDHPGTIADWLERHLPEAPARCCATPAAH